jgi:hypothetical protein
MLACDFPPVGFVKVPLGEVHQFAVPRLVEKIIHHANITFSDLKD